jgi:uncharacterized membrane protein
MFAVSRFLGTAVLVMATGVATVAMSSPAQADSIVTLRVCNHTDRTVLVASSYIPIGGSDWRNIGWTAVGAGACNDAFKTANGTFYARAEVKGDSSKYWGSDIKQCVEYPGPYDFYTGSNDTTCPEGEPQEFTTFHSDGRPVYVWNLTPAE